MSTLVEVPQKAANDYFPPEVIAEFDRIGTLLNDLAHKHGIEFLFAVAASSKPPDPEMRPEFQVNLTSASVFEASRLGLCANWLGGTICPHEMAILVAGTYGDQCGRDGEPQSPEVH
jgi:hypothetical protein